MSEENNKNAANVKKLKGWLLHTNGNILNIEKNPFANDTELSQIEADLDYYANLMKSNSQDYKQIMDIILTKLRAIVKSQKDIKTAFNDALKRAGTKYTFNTILASNTNRGVVLDDESDSKKSRRFLREIKSVSDTIEKEREAKKISQSTASHIAQLEFQGGQNEYKDMMDAISWCIHQPNGCVDIAVLKNKMQDILNIADPRDKLIKYQSAARKILSMHDDGLKAMLELLQDKTESIGISVNKNGMISFTSGNQLTKLNNQEPGKPSAQTYLQNLYNYLTEDLKLTTPYTKNKIRNALKTTEKNKDIILGLQQSFGNVFQTGTKTLNRDIIAELLVNALTGQQKNTEIVTHHATRSRGIVGQFGEIRETYSIPSNTNMINMYQELGMSIVQGDTGKGIQFSNDKKIASITVDMQKRTVFKFSTGAISMMKNLYNNGKDLQFNAITQSENVFNKIDRLITFQRNDDLSKYAIAISQKAYSAWVPQDADKLASYEQISLGSGTLLSNLDLLKNTLTTTGNQNDNTLINNLLVLILNSSPISLYASQFEDDIKGMINKIGELFLLSNFAELTYNINGAITQQTQEKGVGNNNVIFVSQFNNSYITLAELLESIVIPQLENLCNTNQNGKKAIATQIQYNVTSSAEAIYYNALTLYPNTDEQGNKQKNNTEARWKYVSKITAGSTSLQLKLNYPAFATAYMQEKGIK